MNTDLLTQNAVVAFKFLAILAFAASMSLFAFCKGSRKLPQKRSTAGFKLVFSHPLPCSRLAPYHQPHRQKAQEGCICAGCKSPAVAHQGSTCNAGSS